MRSLLWVQLAFDLAMLLALLALERATARRPRLAGPRRELREAAAAAPATGRARWGGRPERQELVAEAALRRRLARFRERVG